MISATKVQSQTNIYFSQQEQTKEKTQSSTMKRKVINNIKSVLPTLPHYVTNGGAYCDKCTLAELVHGYHHGENTDLCIACFNSSVVPEKDQWIEFGI